MSWSKTIALSLFALAMAGCASPSIVSPTLDASIQSASTSVEAASIPPASAFQTITATVKQLLPDDNQGLPHQNFKVTTTDNKVLEVNNDTKYGSKVAGLAVGMTLTIKGTTYPGGIHWTHHANKPGDAGWIKTPDGKLYQ